MSAFLPNFWAAVLALGLLLYVVLDGFDLGVGILFGFAREETTRRQMFAAISPIWDGNETWLIVGGTVLFAAFPIVYALILSTFYLPICLMLCALILRGVAFEFRQKASLRFRPLWSVGFAVGSLVAAFVQGAAVGALVHRLPVGADGRFAGSGAFDWVSPFALLCGVGLCLGDALLGAAWLVLKSQGPLRERSYRLIPWLLAGVLVFLAFAFLGALRMDLPVMHRWVERPWLAIFPVIGLLAVIAISRGVRQRRDAWPFSGAVVIFLAAFATLAASFLPYMVPFTLTISEAAAPASSLSFIFWGAGIVVLPLSLLYTIIVYVVFKGKVDSSAEYD
ncbi:MAG: cytochrome d ubiquinol oxidase subunit II [Steroidobacteraceae bacterium]